MHLVLVREQGDTLTMRYLPLMAWLFIAVACYGMADIALTMARGPQDLGPLAALLMVGGFAAFVGGTVGRMVICRFDRGAGLLRLSCYGLFGLTRAERPLAEVVGLEMRVLRRSLHRIELQLRSGERLPLTPYYLVTFGGGGLPELSRFLQIEPTIGLSATPRPEKR